MALSNLDMNLLKVLHVLIEERSVTEAAVKLGRSQPAISNALNRLRHVLDDDLLVRSAGRLTLTPRAEAIKDSLGKIMELAAFCVADNQPFSAEIEKGELRIAMPNRLSLPILPALMLHLKKQAPDMPLHIINADRKQAAHLVATDQVDLALGLFDQVPSPLNSLHLFSEKFMMLCRQGHPISKVKKPTIDTLLSYSHLVVSSTGQRRGIFDELLAGYERERDVAVSISNFSTAPHLLENSDMIGVFLERVSAYFEKSYALALKPIPLKQNGLDTQLIWHSRNENDPLHFWLREQLQQVCATFT
jgi:DNA-binding transcriptional LysR family regulator